MKSVRLLSLAGLLVGVTTAFNAFAASPADLGQVTYQCRVDGVDSACDALPPSRPSPSRYLVPGSYASYLIYLGQSSEQATAQAHERGDDTVVRIANVTPARNQSGYEVVYQRYLGRESAPGSQVVVSENGLAARR